LIDVSAPAREAGIRYPVALTAAAWQKCVALPPGVTCQDEAGRLGDRVGLLRCAISRRDGGSKVRFGVHVRSSNRASTAPLVQVKAVCGPNDDGSPCITVMIPDED
jgi:hypothetical protein